MVLSIKNVNIVVLNIEVVVLEWDLELPHGQPGPLRRPRGQRRPSSRPRPWTTCARTTSPRRTGSQPTKQNICFRSM